MFNNWKSELFIILLCGKKYKIKINRKKCWTIESQYFLLFYFSVKEI